MRLFKNSISIVVLATLFVGCANKLDESQVDGISISEFGQSYKIGALALRATPDSEQNEAVDIQLADGDAELAGQLGLSLGEQPISSISQYSHLRLAPIDGGYLLSGSVKDEEGCVVTVKQELMSIGQAGKLALGSASHESSCALPFENELNEMVSGVASFFKQTLILNVSQAEDGAITFSVSNLRMSEYINEDIPAEDDGVLNLASITLVSVSETETQAIVSDFTQPPSEK